MDKEPHRIIFDLSIIVKILSEDIYSSQISFVRENIQNAIDAITEKMEHENQNNYGLYKIIITANESEITFEDYGIGMDKDIMINYYWAIGKSTKRSTSGGINNLIGKFGIGGYSNFGVSKYVCIHSKRNGFEICSYIYKQDITGGKNVINFSESNELTHDGTIIKCLAEKKFNIKEINTFIRKFTQYVKIPVYFNDELISNKKFYEESTSQKEIFSEVSNKGINVSGYLGTNNGDVAFFPSKIKIGNYAYNVDGVLSFGDTPVNYYKNNFLMPGSILRNTQVTGNLDLPFINPSASRDSLSSDSETTIQNICKIIFEALINFCKGSNDLFNKYKKYILKYAYSNNIDLRILDNLNIILVNDTSSKRLIDILNLFENTSMKVYYIEDATNNTASNLARIEGIVVVLINYDYSSNMIIKQYLIKYCKAKDAKFNILPLKIYSAHELPEKVNLVYSYIEENIKINYGWTDVEIIIADLSDNTVPMFHKNEDGKDNIYIDKNNVEFVKLTHYAGTAHIRSLVHQFNLGFLGSKLSSVAKEKYKVSFEKFKSDNLFKIIIKNIENVFFRRGGKSWEGPKEVLLKIDSNDYPQMNGYFLKIADPISNNFEEILRRSSKIESTWMWKTLHVFAYHDLDKILKIEINLEKFIEFTHLNSITGVLLEKRKILVYDNVFYIPVETNFAEKYLVPNSSASQIEIEMGAQYLE